MGKEGRLSERLYYLSQGMDQEYRCDCVLDGDRGFVLLFLLIGEAENVSNKQIRSGGMRHEGKMDKRSVRRSK